MTEPVEEATQAPPSPQPSPQRIRRPLLAATLVLLVVIGAIVTGPFWAQPLLHSLPWNAPATSEPDPALAAARDEVKRNAAALQQLAQRVAALEAKPQPDASPLQQRIAALEAKPQPDLSPVQQQLAALAKTTAELSQKTAALDKAVAAQPAADPKNTALALVLLQIREAVEIGRPFEAEYQALAALARDHSDIAAAAEPLAGAAHAGVASRAALIERLRQLAPHIATAKPPPKDTWKSQIVARLRTLVTIRRVDGEDQTSAEAAVNTAQHAMASGDLAGATAALEVLGGANLAAAQPWLQMATARLTVEAALRQAQAALTAALGIAAPAGKG